MHGRARLGKPTARDPETVSRVFGEPILIDGIKLVPVAAVRRCARNAGEHGGCGCVRVRPVGLAVISDGRVSWQPIVDVNRLAWASAGVLAAVCGLGRRRFR